MKEARISPFTRTPGIAGKALIETHYSEDIIQNFESLDSYKYVYKIVGLRGSGKSVEYSLVMDYFREQSNWLVYALSAGGDPLQTLISLMSRENFVDAKTKNRSYRVNAKLGGSLAIASAESGISSEITTGDNDRYYSDEAALKDMLVLAKKAGFRVLIGIDDIAKTDDMVRFLSILGTIFMEPDKDVRFICTGLSKNIEDFVNVPHLSFFVRNKSITMKPLNLHSMTQKYRVLLGISHEQAAVLAKFTCGYAYGYQVLGEICFNLQKSSIDEEVEATFDENIGSQYDLIWSTLTVAEQELVKLILNSETGTVAEIKSKMEKESSFASLRSRLMKKHILQSSARGMINIPLPRFREYVNLWQ